MIICATRWRSESDASVRSIQPRASLVSGAVSEGVKRTAGRGISRGAVSGRIRAHDSTARSTMVAKGRNRR